jgi:hypothetical protein
LAELARPALAGDEEGDDLPYFLFFIFLQYLIFLIELTNGTWCTLTKLAMTSGSH